MADKNRISFTKGRLEALPVPATGRRYVYDQKVPWLALCITSAGAKAFYLYKWANGKPLRVRIGGFPEVSVEHARKTAQKLLNTIAEGRDPQAEKRAVREEATLGRLYEYWIEHAKQHKKSWREDERQFNTFLKPWASRRLSDIEKADVQSLHARVGKQNGKYAANRMLALLRAMLNKAGDIGWKGQNPAVGVKAFREQSRDRYLQPDELAPFFASLTQESELFQDFFAIALLTGARRANVQAMRWDDLNLDLAVWKIPGETAKGGLPILIPLVPRAVEILRRRLEASNGSPWVFSTRSKTGHLVEPKTAWKRICERAGLKDLRPHDLRRTLGSWQAAAGASLPIIGKSLGHGVGSPATAVYARLNLDPVRLSVEGATAAIFAATEKKPEAEESADE